MNKDNVVYMTKFIDKDKPPLKDKGLRLALYQCSSDLGNIEANLETLRFGVKEAKALKSQIVSFPELYLQGYNPTEEMCRQTATSRNDEIMRDISNIAKENKIAILCPYAEKEKISEGYEYYDSMVLYDSDGKELLNYRKTHLWGPYEKSLYSFGYVGESDPFKVVEVNGFRVGVLNCYEAEFPELSRILTLKGAQLLLIPTAADEWQSYDKKEYPPNKGLPYPDVSNTVIPTRAFENSAFCAYVNHCGSEYIGETKRAEYLGNSVIANPFGNIMLKSPNKQSLLVADLKPADFKKSHPTGASHIKNRRIDLYKYLISRDIIGPGGKPYRYPEKPE